MCIRPSQIAHVASCRALGSYISLRPPPPPTSTPTHLPFQFPAVSTLRFCSSHVPASSLHSPGALVFRPPKNDPATQAATRSPQSAAKHASAAGGGGGAVPHPTTPPTAHAGQAKGPGSSGKKSATGSHSKGRESGGAHSRSGKDRSQSPPRQ
jgi:hypothetical protein